MHTGRPDEALGNEATKGIREALHVQDERALAAATTTSSISEAAPGVATRPASAPWYTVVAAATTTITTAATATAAAFPAREISRPASLQFVF